METSGVAKWLGVSPPSFTGGSLALEKAAGEQPSDVEAALGAVGGPRGTPSLKIASRQFGAKVAKHGPEFGLDPSKAEDREEFAKLIQNIRANPDEVRQGAWNPKAGGGTDYYFFRQGQDVLVTKGDGTFVTIPKGGTTNPWYQAAGIVK